MDPQIMLCSSKLKMIFKDEVFLTPLSVKITQILNQCTANSGSAARQANNIIQTNAWASFFSCLMLCIHWAVVLLCLRIS